MSRKFIRLALRRKTIPGGQSVIAASVMLACLLLMIVTAAQAQDGIPPPPLPLDPTPLADMLPPLERAMIQEAQNPKKAVEIYHKLSETHLDAAMAAVKNSNTRTAERELDIYAKIWTEATKITASLQDGKRGLSKKMEQMLYKQLRTLESIERLFPAERLGFAEAAIKKAKQFRVQALNEAFAGGDVLKDPELEKPPTSNEPEKDNPPSSNKPPLGAGAIKIGASYTLAFNQSRLRAVGGGFRYVVAARPSQIPGDYLTEEEDEHVREAQRPDDRIKVFMKIADRRLQALTGAAAVAPDAKAQKKLEEETKEWGALPKLSRAELLRHYTRAIEEGMAKLEDAYERNPKATTIPKALTALRDATDRHLQTLKSFEAEVKDERELSALKDAIDQAQNANNGARDGLKGK